MWSLPHEGDLDANLVALQPGDSVAEHVNDQVDVIIVGVGGRGTVIADGTSLALDGSSVVHVPKGTTRSIHADADERVVYLTVHRARSPLAIGRPRRA